MGAWDVSLYGSDTACDVRDELEVWVRIPGSADDVVQELVGDVAARHDEGDDDYPDFWLALADGLHGYGLDHPETFRRARDVITSGLDLSVKEALGLGPADLRKREAVLAGLLERWSAPAPRPRRRHVLTAPEPFAFPAGTIVAYPTCGGEARNHADVRNRLGWRQDGWGSAVILAVGHEKGWFAWTCAGRLDVHGSARPSFEACRDSAIENQPWDMNRSGKGTLAIQSGALSPVHARRMGLEALGGVPLEPALVAALHPELTAPKRVPLATIHHVFTWWAPDIHPLRELRDPAIAVPSPAAPLRALAPP